MRTGLTLLAGVLLLPCQAGAQEVDKAKLRKAAQMPRLHVSVGLGGSSTSRVDSHAQQPDPQEAIKALRKELKGDSSDADRYHRLAELCKEAKDEKGRQDAKAKAAQLYREQLKQEPKDARLLLRLAECLEDEQEVETL